MTTTTWYGGTDTSFAENSGVAIRNVHSGVWADRAKTTPLSGIRDSTGTPAPDVESGTDGHYDFGVDGHDGTVYLDFGAGVYAVEPRGIGDVVSALKTSLATLTTTVGGLGGGAPAFSSVVAWAPLTAYAEGAWVRPADMSLWFVETGYTSGASYGIDDTANSIQVLPPFYTKAEADAAFAAIGSLGAFTLYASDDINDASNPNLNGMEMQGPGTATSVLPELDEPSDGIVKVGVYRFRSGVSPLCAAVLTIPAYAISPATALALGSISHSVTTAVGNAVVNDAAIGTTHAGMPVEAVGGIPVGCFVGTVIAGVSFRLSSSPLTQVDVVATAAGTNTVHLSPTVAWLAHDRWGAYVLSDGESTYGGAGLKVNVGVGSGSFVVPAAPLAATSFTVTSTSVSATLNWVAGVGATEHEVWMNGKPIARGFNLTTYVHTWVAGETTAAFKILSRVPGAVGPFTATINATPSAVWSLFPQATAGIWDNTKYSTVIGTNGPGSTPSSPTPPSATVDAASGGHQLAHLRSAGTGSTTVLNDPQDRVLIKAITDLTPRRAWGFRCLLSPLTSSALLEIYLGMIGGTIGVASGGTDWLRTTLQPGGCDLAGKAASYDPTGEGNGTTVGSFQRFTDTSYATNILTGASRVSGGLIPFASAMAVGGPPKGFKILADVISTTQQRVTVYYGDATQYGTDGSGLPELFHADLTARFTSARQAGNFYLQQLGKQTTPTAVTGWDIQDYCDIIPVGV